ncbi:MAG: cytochrome c oxidase subunit II [Verrucomicrobia bacterium]|nr:cytochrome c oxidase subunit II [Verrucomicrobiota bacterium]MBV9644292.1 cytochrome c oxidase subunit II [Verrucomicrobiota bacterium]
MRQLFSFIFPDQASNLAPSVDAIFFALVVLCSVITLLVFVVALFFCVRFRRGSKVDRTPPKGGTLRFEIAWTLIPFFVFCGLFFWAADVYFAMSRPPGGATEIHVVGKQWMWKIQHPDGRREINELHVPVGRPVKLIMTSEDVIHDFFVPAFRAKQDVVPGRYTTEWFTPTKPGRYHLFCSQYCGTNHSTMVGWVYVMEPAEHARWLNQVAVSESLVAEGERHFHSRGCSGCHAPNSQIHAPLLEGIYGKPVPLSDGTIVIADEQYLRDSILLPNKQVAAGYEPIMPTFQGRISEEEVNAIVAYLKHLTDSERSQQ